MTTRGRREPAPRVGTAIRPSSADGSEVQGERLAAQRELEASKPTPAVTVEELREIIDGLGDVRVVLADADPALKAQLYADLGVTMTYRPAERSLPSRLGHVHLNVSEGRV
jgi:hypothetical protein